MGPSLAGLKDFKKVANASEETAKLQERLQEFFQPLMINPTLDGVLLSNIKLSAAVTKVSHKLNRPAIGWIIVKKSANADIWEPVQTLPSSYIELQATTDVVVSLWVF